MTFPLDDILLGPATFGRLHRLDMVIGHTGEEPGVERKYAVATANYQLTHPGSYSFRVYDRRSDPRGVMLNVPWLEASGGINPNSTAWAPERYPWIREQLAKSGPCPKPGCPGPYLNPTMHAGQISFVGRTDRLQHGAPPNYVPDGKALIAWYDKHPLRGPAPLVVIMHGHLQTNRSDWGTWMQAQLTATPEDDVDLSTFTPIINRRVILADGATPRYTPAFDRTNYDANAVLDTDGSVIREKAGRSRVAVGWVNGTNLTLANGTVLNPSVKWLLTNSDTKGGIFYHEQDVADFQVIETVETGPTQADIDAAVAAALAAFNKNLDVWTGTRPKS